MVCYRRRGHNEGDDPSMTQPPMYALIEAKRSVRKLYTEALIGRGDITRGGRGGAARLPGAARAGLRRDHEEARRARPTERDLAADDPQPRLERPPRRCRPDDHGGGETENAISADELTTSATPS